MTRLLIIEDDMAILSALRALMETEGYSVVTAVNGREGLAELRRQPIDLILTDLLMPTMNGYEFMLERKKDPVLRRIPVVAMTAAMSKQEPDISGAFHDFLVKPLDLDYLLETVKRGLNAPPSNPIGAR